MNKRQTLTESILLNRIPELKRVHLFDELESTNDFAKHILQAGSSELPALIYTPNQTKGRGRGANRWISSAGSLTFSLLLNRPSTSLELNESLLWGIAIAQCLRKSTSDQPGFQIKWPNDVLAGGKKVAGILIETISAKPETQIVGIGINLNNRITVAPIDSDRFDATSVVEFFGQELDPIDILELVWRHFQDLVAKSTTEILAEFSALDFLANRTISIDLNNESIVGICQGISPNGSLIIKVDEQERWIASGARIQVLSDQAMENL